MEGVRDFQNPFPSYVFRWGLGEVVTAVAEAGLALSVLREYPYVNGGKPAPGARDLPGGRWALPEGSPALPLMYGLAARRPGP
jgi:hypothetical protein